MLAARNRRYKFDAVAGFEDVLIGHKLTIHNDQDRFGIQVALQQCVTGRHARPHFVGVPAENQCCGGWLWIGHSHWHFCKSR